MAIASDLPVIYHPEYVAPLPENHRFPMTKFRLLRDLLLTENVVNETQFHEPEFPTDELLQLVHTPDYITAYQESPQCSNPSGKLGWG